MTGSSYQQLSDGVHSSTGTSPYSSSNNDIYNSKAASSSTTTTSTTTTMQNSNTTNHGNFNNFDPNMAIQHTSSFSLQFQDFQTASPEQKHAIHKFSHRLKLTIMLLLPMLIIMIFTTWWWTTFALLSLLGCVTVYYRAANKNQRVSIIAFLILLFLNEIVSIAMIIYQFAKIIHLSKLEIAVMIIAFFDVIIAGPLNMYVTYWLLKSIQLDVYYLSQPVGPNGQ
jgi:cation transport ATPase